MSLFEPHRKISLAICSPHRAVKLPNGQVIVDTVTIQWHRARTALGLPTNCNFVEFFADGMEIGVARDGVTRRVLQHDPTPEFLFFLDDDVLPDHDALTKLFFRLRTMPDYDVAAGVYCCKWQVPSDPLIYTDYGQGGYWDWAVGDLLTTEQHGIKATHMGLTLIRTSLFQRMLDQGVIKGDEPFFKTVNEVERVNGVMKSRQGTEDLYFYALAEKAGCKIIVDTSVLAGHIDKRTGVTWGLPEDSPPVQRARWLQNKDKEPDTKLALDLGAGGHKRSWPGHKTYTTDIRADAKPDYVQDTLWLNLPSGHFDLVASSHHLEHIGRWDQERAWGEVWRVCKPGGSIEHIVPSLEWAAHKIADGCVDEHVLNVLYGAQEQHGYARQYNLHYFGYTKDIAVALAEQAGFVGVTCEDWRDTPSLGYNLVIRGNKPAAVETEHQPAAGSESESAQSIPDHNGELIAVN